jgi:hypothetical protein
MIRKSESFGSRDVPVAKSRELTMSGLKAERVDEIPPRRGGERGATGRLVQDFIDSEDRVWRVSPDDVPDDDKARKKQVASIYNTLKYHLARKDPEGRASVTVRNWDVYLEKVQP